MKGPQDPSNGAFGYELPPREKNRRFYKIIRPRAAETVKGLCLSDRPLITRSHYQAKQTFVCIGPDNGCPFCKNGIRQMIKGYFAGQDMLTGKNALIELTDNALYETPVIATSKASLRGKVCVLTRRGKEHNSPVTAHFEQHPSFTGGRQPRKPFDVVAALLEMWEVPIIEIDPHTGEAMPYPPHLLFRDETAKNNPDQPPSEEEPEQ